MFKRFALAAATFGMVMVVSGCTGPLTQDTLTGPNASRNGELQHDRHRAQPGSSSYGDLLYVEPNNRTAIAYYTYPAGELVGTLNGGGSGLCADSSGNVFVVSHGSIQEFAHGGTSPINTLGDPSYNYFSCSVDPTTGNLAVTFEDYSAGPTTGNLAVTPESSGGAGIAIFKNATGNQTTYTDADFSHLFFCGYDGSGNLFADGQIGGNPAAFAELPAGGSKLETVLLNQYLEQPGQVQWDGEHLTIADEHNHRIYRGEINGSEATVVGTTKLNGGAFFGSWIYGGTVIVPVPGKHKHGPGYIRFFNGPGYIRFFNYPQGGKPTKIFPGPGYDTEDGAVTISPGK